MQEQKKILVVDDEEGIISFLKLRLEAEGYLVETAYNGAEALEKVEVFNPDLIILDVMMPVMDGFDLYKRLKQDTLTAEIPVVILTSRGMMRDTFEVLEADDFIAKPFDGKEVISSVMAILTKKSLVLGEDPKFLEVVTQALESLSCSREVVKGEQQFFERVMKGKYCSLILHLPLITLLPKELIAKIRISRNKNAIIAVYSDARVEGTENNETEVIDHLRIEWEAAGVDIFYDSRIARSPFKSILTSRGKKASG